MSISKRLLHNHIHERRMQLNKKMLAIDPRRKSRNKKNFLDKTDTKPIFFFFLY